MNELQLIQSKIYEVRGQKVILDRDLAELYNVTTANLNKAVKRNIRRFPDDFMFQLTKAEFDELKTNLIFTRVRDNKSPNGCSAKRHRLSGDPVGLP
ncbi:ORF6N domain-containing protein, partial [uncultured Muribaculum sp.]|uniref:ORF6N domain-containing protein n=1 Tax=uncultured Muribaculum sp. TaxID=1918613 RepID=UPI002599D9D1